MKPNHHTQGNIVIVGTGAPSIGMLAASLVTAFAANTAVVPSIRPHTTTLKADRDRYDQAIAGGCKSTTPTLTGHRHDTIAQGSNPMTGRDTFHDADEYARKTVKAITDTVTDFASHFRFNESATTNGNDPSWHPYGAS